MPITRRKDATPVDQLPKVVRRTMTAGDKMMLIEVEIGAGGVVPMHTHPHEQTGYLVRGRMRLQIGDDSYDLDPGDCWMIPGGVPHEATGLDDSLIVDVFSPPREDYR